MFGENLGSLMYGDVSVVASGHLQHQGVNNLTAAQKGLKYVFYYFFCLYVSKVQKVFRCSFLLEIFMVNFEIAPLPSSLS